MLLEASGGLKLRDVWRDLPSQSREPASVRLSVEERSESMPGHGLITGVTKRVCQSAWLPYFLFRLGYNCDTRMEILSRGPIEVDIGR